MPTICQLWVMALMVLLPEKGATSFSEARISSSNNWEDWGEEGVLTYAVICLLMKIQFSSGRCLVTAVKYYFYTGIPIIYLLYAIENM